MQKPRDKVLDLMQPCSTGSPPQAHSKQASMHEDDLGLRLIVSFQYPHRICATGVSTNEFLGYLDRELHGHSLLMFCLLSTDMDLIVSAISEAAMSRSMSFTAWLRNKQGFSQLYSMTTFPFWGDGGELVGCMFLLQRSSLRPSDNCGFIGIGSTAGNLVPPATEALCLGQGQKYFMGNNTSSHFKEWNCQASLFSQNFPSIKTQSDEYRPDASSTVLPRRRCGSRPNPVVVTPDTIQSLQCLPVHKAADVIGISATALKRACRRLGVRRWPYHRGTSKAVHGPGLGAQPGPRHAAPHEGWPADQSAESLAESFLLDGSPAPFDDTASPPDLPGGGPYRHESEPSQTVAEGSSGGGRRAGSGAAFLDPHGLCELPLLDDEADDEFARVVGDVAIP
jgi:hypothetical protein